MSDTPDAITILIVDDNRNNLFTLHNLINEYLSEIEVVEAESGAVALNTLVKRRIDLIILDVQMPEMDGFEAARLIRSRKKNQHIPIVFLTAAYKSEEFRQRGYNLGAADYLTKPIDAPQLISRIHLYIRFIQQERAYSQMLEKKVEERTAKLAETNTLLKQEIAERKHIESALQQAKEFAEASNLAKSQFLANMSHELRTPLNAIIGYSEIIHEELSDQGQEDLLPDLDKIKAAGKHLLGLINDILDLSKIEAGRMDLFFENFNLSTLLDEILATTFPLAEKRGNELKVVSADNTLELYSDMTKLRQILINLLSNAIKFTEKGTVSLEIQLLNEDKWIEFRVVDNGIGMSEEQQAKIFQPFVQADASTTRRYGGTGLGLVLSKRFTQMLGGHIFVNSEFGVGSVFTMQIPRRADLPEIAESELTSIFGNEKIRGEGIVLVIDHDTNTSQSLKQQLSQLGYAVAIATNRDEALALTQKLRPDAILLDTDMPGMDSWRILAALKANPLINQIPVIIVAFQEQAQSGAIIGTGMDYLTKPLHRQDLVQMLNKYNLGDPAKSLIMVVDDDQLVRRTMSIILEKEGWRVVMAENGQIALEQLEIRRPSLIILDLNMPVMDGFEFIEHFQKKPEWRDIPVVVLTAINLDEKDYARLGKTICEIFRKDSMSSQSLIHQLHQLISSKIPPPASLAENPLEWTPPLT